MQIIRAELEEWNGSPVIRDVGKTPPERLPTNQFRDKPARLTERQAVFHRNLARLSKALGSRRIPVDFVLEGRGHVYLDRGCIKIAEHARIIEPLQNGPSGRVDYVELSHETEL